MNPVSSRYYGIAVAQLTASDGRRVAFLTRRFVPIAPLAVQAEHRVSQGDRLDNITAKYLGDPEQFWQLCDANLALNPDELTAEIGRCVIIPSFLG